MEDYSINSSIHKSAISKDDSVEESGWTAYFEDFSNHQQQKDSYSYSFDCDSSLISDAATAWKSPHNIDHHHHVFPKKLRFKKTRTKEIYEEDDSLEDTASSPVNSPKGKETATDIQIEEENKLKFRYGKNDCTELNKRGLCLVPFSMLANYLGQYH
ncbi:hypothetical protein E1A91_A12G169700v1 [Gossypium mustelinum]|uniref:Uncharacterized protein n=1 Tax=Gossypium mustelinum TaxID=34275 RepID=A0A5D2WWS7_GOSMU|nr:vascular-related unknown protein 1 isoform X2 [Gossypium arboreum]TYJ05521.1 hypothetical protein E1A91_A12G169700v1 [Gossypium mustelinum]